jgi:hypothetical protein
LDIATRLDHPCATHRIARALIGGLSQPGIPAITAPVVTLLLLCSTGIGLAQPVDTTLWVTNGTVYSIVRDGGTIYIGGNFTQVGPAIGGAVTIDAGTGAARQPHPDVAGNVHAVAPDGNGGWYLGGDFTAVRGQPRNNLAHLDAGGNLTAWNPIANNRVRALAVRGGIVYAGGVFTAIGGQPRTMIAALDAASGAATAWNPNAGVRVDDLAVGEGTVYAGGGFTSIGGAPRNFIAALDATSGAATAWNPNADGYVNALTVSGSTVYAGGRFASIAGQPQRGMAAISADMSTATLLAQFDATATAEGVELRWRFGDAGGVTTVAVERARNTSGPWVSITPELHDESGVTVALDRTGEGNMQYLYRLMAQLVDGSQVVFGPVSARRRELLARSDLTLVSPNPTSGGAQVHYAVARAGRVWLELLDVSGRVVETMADRTHMPGRYVTAWDGAGQPGRLAPGLYFVRLVAPDHVAVRRLAIIR